MHSAETLIFAPALQVSAARSFLFGPERARSEAQRDRAAASLVCPTLSLSRARERGFRRCWTNAVCFLSFCSPAQTLDAEARRISVKSPCSLFQLFALTSIRFVCPSSLQRSDLIRSCHSPLIPPPPPPSFEKSPSNAHAEDSHHTRSPIHTHSDEKCINMALYHHFSSATALPPFTPCTTTSRLASVRPLWAPRWRAR